MHLLSSYFGGKIFERCGFDMNINIRIQCPTTDGWMVLLPVIEHKERNVIKYWNLSETEQQTAIPSRTKLATVR